MSKRSERLYVLTLFAMGMVMVSVLVWQTHAPARAAAAPARPSVAVVLPQVLEAMKPVVAAAPAVPPPVHIAKAVVESAPAVLPGGATGDELEYDRAGNLTYDGVYHYTYDAWNRQVKVTKAYRDEDHELQLGSTVQENEYDGTGRRIVVKTQNSGDLDGTEHVYYDGWSQVETRNGSGIVTKQMVWAGRVGGYIDELLQIAHNLDWPDALPAADQTAETQFWAMQDANYNVLGIVDESGKLVERYEYTPYGQRTTFNSTGSNDWELMSAKTWSAGIHASPELHALSGRINPYGITGKSHEHVSDLIHFNSRFYSSSKARFLQRDAYVSSRDFQRFSVTVTETTNLYSFLGGSPLNHTDPTGYFLTGCTSSPEVPDMTCKVVVQPTYKPSGKITPTVNADGWKFAQFKFTAEFDHDPENGISAACCEVRQFLSWANSHMAPHSGFPRGATASTWYEDRNTKDQRYGHRTGIHMFGAGGSFDEYLNAQGDPDRMLGTLYRGSDYPKMPPHSHHDKARWRFVLTVVDVCNGTKRVAESTLIDINW